MERADIERRAILCFVLAFCISKAWTLLPESTSVHNYFPFNDQELTLRMHAWFLCKIVELVIIYYGITILTVHVRTEVAIIWVLYVLDILDYLLFYSEPLFYVRPPSSYLTLFKPFPVEYGLLKGLVLITIFGFTVVRWKK